MPTNQNKTYKVRDYVSLKALAFEQMLHQADYANGETVMDIKYKEWYFLVYLDDCGTLTLKYDGKGRRQGCRTFMFMGQMWLFILQDLLEEYDAPVKFESYIDMTKYNDSLELESGQEVARLEDGLRNLVVTVEVRGEVRIEYKGTTYSTASSMPKRLLQLIHDGKADSKHGVYIEDNNWFEVFVWDNKNNVLEWTGYSDVVDIEGNNEEQMKAFLTDCLDIYLSL